MRALGGFLFDTNVISESRKLRPDARVVRFIEEHDRVKPHISVLTLGELWKGAAKRQLQDKAGAEELAAWIQEIEHRFAGRVLDVDAETARLWGEWSSGRTRPVIDTLLAATAVRHGLTLVTRNTADMAGLPVSVVNPWEG